MTGYTHDGPQILDADASWDLVEGTHVARLAVSVRGEPDIYPVTVRAHGDLLLLEGTVWRWDRGTGRLADTRRPARGLERLH